MAMQFDDGEDLPDAHEINVTPFIDVMLVLLIIFMVAAPLATVDVPVNLPTASASATTRPDKPVMLTLKADASLMLGEQTVDAAALGQALDAATGSDHSHIISLRADKTVSYDDLMATMERLRQAGYLKIGLVAALAP